MPTRSLDDILTMLANGESVKSVANATGSTPESIRYIAEQYWAKERIRELASATGRDLEAVDRKSRGERAADVSAEVLVRIALLGVAAFVGLLAVASAIFLGALVTGNRIAEYNLIWALMAIGCGSALWVALRERRAGATEATGDRVLLALSAYGLFSACVLIVYGLVT